MILREVKRMGFDSLRHMVAKRMRFLIATRARQVADAMRPDPQNFGVYGAIGTLLQNQQFSNETAAESFSTAIEFATRTRQPDEEISTYKAKREAARGNLEQAVTLFEDTLRTRMSAESLDVPSVLRNMMNLFSTKLRLIESTCNQPGFVTAFAGEEVPTGFLLCNGAQLLRVDYPALFAVIGTAHGGVGEHFNLPDYRGRFIRGVDDTDLNRDPNRLNRLAMAPGGNQRGVGSTQNYSTAKSQNNSLTVSGNTADAGNHTHKMYTGWCQRGFNTGLVCFATHLGNDVQYMSDDQQGSGNHCHTFFAQVEGGDAETRPCNANVHFIIKF
jgi:hypothetical protein